MTKITYSDITNFKYVLTEPYSLSTDIKSVVDIHLDKIKLIAGVISIDAGYLWNGSSGPTVDTESSMRASLIHDSFYSLIHAGLLPSSFRPDIDILYRNICIEDGMSEFRAKLHYYAIRAFGMSSARAS